MKNAILIAIAALFCVSAFCDECWSTGFRFDGSEITEEAILLKPTDPLAYSSALAEGEPKSLTINVEDTANPEISASVFADYSETAVEGTTTWDYTDEDFKDFPTDDTYLLTETVTSDAESKVLKRTVTILPEPIGLLLIAFIGALILRKRTKSLIAILAIIALSSLNAKADSCVSNVNCMQMWPFDRGVIINFTLTSNSAEPVFSVKFYGSLDNGKTTFNLAEKGTISRDGANGTIAGTGEFKTFWTPDESFYETYSDDMLVKVEATEQTPPPPPGNNTYMIVDLSGGTNATRFAISYLDDVPEGGWTEEYKTTKLVLRNIELGSFTMGSPEDEFGRYSIETQHEVTLTNAYYIGIFETTQKQYELIMGSNPSYYEGDARPVECVSYNTLRGIDKGAGWPTSYDVDDDSFFGILRTKTQMTFDLPTEAQWEFACRAGTTTALNSGKNLSDKFECDEMAEVGRYYYNKNDGKGGYSEHTVVGSYIPNAWGLYDMHGNVNEWCLDWYQDLGNDSAIEPLGTNWGSNRVLRGGEWYEEARYCRSAYRIGNEPRICYERCGFRVALVQNVFSSQNDQIKKTFEFDIESETESTLPIFQTKFYGKLNNGTEKLLEEMGRLEYDGASGIVAGIGKHKLTWIPDVAYTNIMDEVELRVEYEDVTEQATYLVLDTTSNKMRVSLKGPDTTEDKCRTDELWLKRIEPGIFTMGSPEDELGRSGDEELHEVTLTKAYYIGVFEMTQKQCQNIMGANPSYYFGNTRPVEGVTYDMIRGQKKGSNWPDNNEVDENSFMGQLRKKVGNIFDLPTEAQWEFACRAGTTTALNNGTNISDEEQCSEMAKVGRYYYNKNDGKGGYSEHTVVGSYIPNAWGLYDLHGNVFEWCLDWYSSYDGDAIDPKGGEYNGHGRVFRGGSWGSNANVCRSADRRLINTYNCDDTGFRVVLVP